MRNRSVMTALGLAVSAVGVLAVGVGGWAAMNARRPPWLSERTIPVGRERQWGLAISVIGFGQAVLGAFRVSAVSGAAFGALGIIGIGLMLAGVGILVIAVRTDSVHK